MIRIQSWVGERQDRTGVVQQAADVVARDIGQSCVASFVVEEWLAVLPQRLVRVHTGAIVTCKWLGHKGCGLVESYRGVFDDVLESLDVIGRMQHGVEAVVDFLLSAGADLAVEALNLETDFLQSTDHGIADLNGLVIRRGREVAALFAVLVTEVWGAIKVRVLTAVPPTLVGINVVESLVCISLVLDGVEEVELCFRAELTGICDTGGDQVLLSLARNVARVAGERLMGERIMYKALNVQGLFRTERIDVCRVRIREQGHVRFIDGGKTINGRAIKSHSFFSGVLIELGSRDAEVMFFAWDVGKADVNKFYVFISDKLHNLRDAGKCHGCS